MSEQRQKRRNSILAAQAGSEASESVAQVGESQATISENENLATTAHLMEEVLDAENLKLAVKRVMQNKGAAGVDGVTVDRLPSYLAANWIAVRKQLLSGTYAPQAVRRVEIPKATGGVRQLGIPSVIDRFIQQALQQVLQRHWDGQFSQYSYGFRPGRSQHQAIEQAQKYVCSGLQYVVDIDLEKFFDKVNHDILMSRVTKRVSDKRVLKLIRSFLNSGMMENGLVNPTEEGVPQGGPLSPLLSNLLLDDLDRELERRNLHFVRYADDCNIYVASQKAGQRVMEGITNFLSKRLRLKVNETKSAVGRPWERKFLGFTFLQEKRCRRLIAPAALKRARAKIQLITRRNRGHSLEQIVHELKVYLRGWVNYFGYSELPEVLRKLESYTRRKLRCLIWKRWKHNKTRFAKLRALGLSEPQARAGTGDSSKGPWRMSHTPALDKALSVAYFRDLGLPELKCKVNA